MTQSSTTWSVTTTLPSRRGAHLPLMEEALDRLTAFGWTAAELFGVQMALEESLTNAIRHGNKCDESKQVHVSMELSPERFWLDVEDEGPGFNPDQVADCTLGDGLEKCGGRGVLLMRAFMTSVKYNSRGNRVTLEKLRDSAASEAG